MLSTTIKNSFSPIYDISQQRIENSILKKSFIDLGNCTRMLSLLATNSRFRQSSLAQEYYRPVSFCGRLWALFSSGQYGERNLDNLF